MAARRHLSNIWDGYLRYAIIPFTCLLFLFQQQTAYEQPVNPPSAKQNIFAILANVEAKDRVEKATYLYKYQYALRKAPATVAMAGLDKLTALALQLHDKSLECSVFDLRADYYSVNNGFNSLSTAFYQKAIDFAIANMLPFETGLYLHQMGQYYSTFKHNAEACRYFLRSQTVFERIGFENVPDMGIYFSHIGDFYYALGDYDNAKNYLGDALHYPMENQRDQTNILNTIGLIYRSNRQFEKAINYFEKTLNLANAAKDTVWQGIATGNIGSVYFLENRYQQALPFIETDYQVSMKYGEKLNGVIALLRLAKINIDQKKLNDAKQQLETAGAYLENSHNDVLNAITDYYDLKSQFYEKLGQSAQSIVYFRKFEQDKDSLAKRNNIAAVERVKLRYEIDKHNAEVAQLKADASIQSLKIKAALIVLALLIGISFLAYNNQRVKGRKDKALLMAEKRRVDEELKNAGEALGLYTENLRQKNILIENFKAEIERLNLQSANNADAGELERLLEAHIMTDRNWQEFKQLFSRVYPGFFVNLSREHPLLSSADTRMLALIKLGLNNSEMANMLGITIEGIQKAKQRLRKKMDVTTITGIGQDVEVG